MIDVTIRRDRTKENIFFFPIENDLLDVRIYDSAGKKLPTISVDEAKAKFDITEEILKQANAHHDEPLDYIPILVPISDSDIEILHAEYASAIDPKRYHMNKFKPGMQIEFRFRFTPAEYIINDHVAKIPYAMHVTFVASEDYSIKNYTSVVIEKTTGNTKIEPHMNLPNTLTFNTVVDYHSHLKGAITMRIASSISSTAWVVSVAGVFVPLLLVLGQLWTGKFFEPTLEILGGMIAVLIGSRVWVIRDKYIMRRWVAIHYLILGINVAMFVLWFITWLLH